MEFKIEKASLLQGLYLAQGISDRKSTMPILANVLLRTDGKDKLLVAATDLNVTVTAELPCKVAAEGGLTVGAKHLHEIVKSLPTDELSLKRTENNYAEIRAGKIEYKVVGMADREFPKLPNHREVKFSKVDAATLRDMIAKTFFSISTDETRYHLNGVLFESDGKLARMVSTDGHRLSKIERALEGGPKLATGIIIPRKGLMELRRALENAEGQIELGIHGGHVFVRVKEVALSVKLIEAQFPPYDQVIPKENDKVAICPRLAMLESLKRIKIISSDKTSGVKLSLKKGALNVASDNPDLGEAHEELDVSYDGAPITIGFNATYFIDLLTEMEGDEVKLELNGELDPGLVRPADGKGYLGVVMPMRI
ncbi:MAG TPA: DNA polymerase III subunit beta [Polyangia bacterium]|nr:DNA polymerase III subunit beta [Polyangia bacterium]